MFDFDPRDREDDVRDLEMPWIELSGAPSVDREQDDLRDRDEDLRDRDRDPRERDLDPRDVFLDGLELPRGLERETVMDGDHRYELHGDDGRSLAIVGAFRVVANTTSAIRATSRAVGVSLTCVTLDRFLPCCREQLAKLNLHMHDLRREAGSRLLERGADLHTVQLFLDHANISTSSRYLKPSKLALHTTIQRIDGQRRASGEAAKWERDLAEMKKNLQEVPQKRHKLVESTAKEGSEKTATAR